jgi:hypothetical protein
MHPATGISLERILTGIRWWSSGKVKASAEFAIVQVADDCWLTLMAGRASTDTFAATTARGRMFENVSESAAEGSPDKNALTADVNQPETINSNGVFSVMAYLRAFQISAMRLRAKEGSSRRQRAVESGTEGAGRLVKASIGSTRKPAQKGLTNVEKC